MEAKQDFVPVPLADEEIPVNILTQARVKSMGGPLAQFDPPVPQAPVTASDILKFGGRAGVYAGMTGLGMLGGGLLGGPPGAIAGGAVLGGASPFAAKALGLQKEVSPLDVALGALPMPGAAASRGLSRTIIPGIETGLQQGIVRQAARLPGRFLPSRPSSQLFAEAERLSPGVMVPVANIQKVAQELAAIEAKLLPELQSKAGLKTAEVARKVAAQPAGMPLQEFHANMSRIGQQFRDARTVYQRSGKQGERVRSLGKLYGGMADALDNALATGGPAVSALKDAKAAYKQELFADELRDAITKNTISIAGRPSFNADGVLRLMLPNTETRATWQKLVPASQWTDLEKTLKAMAKVSGGGMGTKTGLAGMSFPQRAMAQTGLGAIGGILGFQAGGAGGGLAGAAGGVLATEALYQLLATAPGRTLARAIAGSPRLTGPLAPSIYDQLVNAGASLIRAQSVQIREKGEPEQ